MVEYGYDWKKAVREAGRVLKPGGRFLFVESAEVDGESFLEEVMSLSEGGIGGDDSDEDLETESEISIGGSTADNLELAENRRNDQRNVIFSEVGFDNVDLVLQPHVAGVAIKAMDADLTMQQRLEKRSQEEEDRLADLSLSAFERGSKKRRRKKVKKGGFGGNDNKEEMGTVS
jgi:SAM-dependent methyltransferase